MKSFSENKFVRFIVSHYEPVDIVIPFGFLIITILELFFIKKSTNMPRFIIYNTSFLVISVIFLYHFNKINHPPITPWIKSIFILLYTIFPSLLFLYEQGKIIPIINSFRAEKYLLMFDKKLFGVNPSAFLEAYHVPWFTEILQFIYASFYFLPLVFVIILFFQKRWHDISLFIFGIQFAFYFSFFIYFTVPAKSPYRLYETNEISLALNYKNVNFKGIKYTKRIRAWLDRNESNPFDCFPSGHTMISTVLLIFSFILYRKSFWFYLPVIVLLIFSTIYLKYHYFMDLIVGLTLGTLSVPVSMRIFDWWEKIEPHQKNSMLMHSNLKEQNPLSPPSDSQQSDRQQL